MALAFSTLFAEPENTNLANATSLVAQAFAKQKEKRQEKVLMVLGDVVDAAQAAKACALERLRTLRREEAAAKKKLEDLTRAFQYLEVTGNFGPLAPFMGYGVVRSWCAKCDVAVPTEDEQKVPDGWTPDAVAKS